MRRSIIVETFGGPDALHLVSENSLPLPDHSVRVAIKACGVNRADVLLRSGSYHGVAAPARPGIEASGEVVESSSARFPVGARVVIFANRTGLYTTETVSSEHEICLIPDGVSFERAAALPINWLTAWRCLHALIKLRADDVILIPAAASGVGTAAIQIARQVGATIIAAAGSAEKLQVAQELGAHFVVNYREANLAEAVRECTHGKGASAFLDAVGGAIFSAGLKALASFGRVAALANVTLEDSLINTRDFYPKNAEIYGFQFGNLLAAGRYDPAPDMTRILDFVADGTFAPHIARTFPLTEVAEAHRFLESREVIGKLLLAP
jgi:NADPH2:quinone reductase